MYWNREERKLTYRLFVAGESAAALVRRVATDLRAAAGWRGWLRPLPLEGSPETVLVATRSVPTTLRDVRAEMMVVTSSGPPGARTLAFNGADAALVLDGAPASFAAVERWIAELGYDPATFVGVAAASTEPRAWIRFERDVADGLEPLLLAVAEACEREAIASIGELRPRRAKERRDATSG